MAGDALSQQVETLLHHGGWSLPCPRCGELGASISINLHDPSTMTCLECEEDFTAEQLQALIVSWQPILAWLATLPAQS